MKKQIMQYWRSLKEQEQQLIMVAGGIFVIFVLVMGIFRPLNNAIDKAKKSYVTQQELLVWVDESIVKLKAAGNTQAISNQNISQVVNSTRSRYRITISKMQPNDNSLRLTLDSVEFNQLIEWLDELVNQHGLRVENLDLSKDDKSGFVSFIVFCIMKLPAAIALDLAKPYLPKQLEIGQTVGSVWQGQMMQVRYQDEQLNNVRWDIAGWQLFTGNLNANLKFGNPRERSDISGYADVNYGLFNNVVKVTDGIIRSTVERAMQRIALPIPATAKGRVILELNEYTSGVPYCESLKGEIASPNIDVKGFNGWFNIGPLSGMLSCKSGDIAILVDPDNTLGLEADATLKANFDFKVAGYVKPDASLPKDVHDAVKFLGRPDTQGRYPLNF